MRTLLIITPFLLGNSAPIGALIPLLISGVIGIGIVIGIIYGIIRWLA